MSNYKYTYEQQQLWRLYCSSSRTVNTGRLDIPYFSFYVSIFWNILYVDMVPMDLKLPQMNSEFWTEAMAIWIEILAALAESK